MNKILIIEDDPLTLQMLENYFETNGFQVFIAPNGIKGEQILNQHKVDIIITDLYMPEQNGLVTIQNIRRQFGMIKIIAISGGYKIGYRFRQYSAEPIMKLAKKFGADRVIQKPFELTSLMQSVVELIH